MAMNGIATNQLPVSPTQTLVHNNITPTTPTGINTMSTYQTPRMVMQRTPGVLQGSQSFPASQHMPPPMQAGQPLIFAQHVTPNRDISQSIVQMVCTLGSLVDRLDNIDNKLKIG